MQKNYLPNSPKYKMQNAECKIQNTKYKSLNTSVAVVFTTNPIQSKQTAPSQGLFVAFWNRRRWDHDGNNFSPCCIVKPLAITHKQFPIPQGA